MAGQHTANKAEALVCSVCFRFLASVEAQIAHRLLSNAAGTTAGGDISPTLIFQTMGTSKAA